jgi:cytochrome c-type biogenesis protein CcmH/NrfG
MSSRVASPVRDATALFARDREAARSAVRRLSRRLLAQSDDAEAWHALGAALTLLGDRAAALAAYRNALRIDDSRVRSQLALGNLLFDSGQCERALSCFGITGKAP